MPWNRRATTTRMSERSPGLGDALFGLLASGLYSGFLPKAPGTFGTVVAVLFYLLLHMAFSGWSYVAAVAIFILAACIVAGRAERMWGQKDCQRIVIDEWAGFLTTMAAVTPTLFSVCAAFLLFRFFDVLKPFPIRYLERLPGGAGVVADDVGAGIYGCGVLHLVLYLLAKT